MAVIAQKKGAKKAKGKKKAGGKKPGAKASGAKSDQKRFRGEVFIVRELCKGCGFCVEFCPTHVLALDKDFNRKGYHPPIVVDLDSCNGCDLCGLYCPDFAIHGHRFKVGKAGGQ